MSIAASLQSKSEQAFAPLHFELENESSKHHRGGAETHFRLLIVSAHFEGLSRVDRHRQVQALFEEERQAGLHALALWTYTPSEWLKIRQSGHQTTSPECESRRPSKNTL